MNFIIATNGDADVERSVLASAIKMGYRDWNPDYGIGEGRYGILFRGAGVIDWVSNHASVGLYYPGARCYDCSKLPFGRIIAVLRRNLDADIGRVDQEVIEPLEMQGDPIF